MTPKLLTNLNHMLTTWILYSSNNREIWHLRRSALIINLVKALCDCSKDRHWITHQRLLHLKHSWSVDCQNFCDTIGKGSAVHTSLCHSCAWHLRLPIRVDPAQVAWIHTEIVQLPIEEAQVKKTIQHLPIIQKYMWLKKTSTPDSIQPNPKEITHVWIHNSQGGLNPKP